MATTSYLDGTESPRRHFIHPNVTEVGNDRALTAPYGLPVSHIYLFLMVGFPRNACLSDPRSLRPRKTLRPGVHGWRSDIDTMQPKRRAENRRKANQRNDSSLQRSDDSYWTDSFVSVRGFGYDEWINSSFATGMLFGLYFAGADLRVSFILGPTTSDDPQKNAIGTRHDSQRVDAN